MVINIPSKKRKRKRKRRTSKLKADAKTKPFNTHTTTERREHSEARHCRYHPTKQRRGRREKREYLSLVTRKHSPLRKAAEETKGSSETPHKLKTKRP